MTQHTTPHTSTPRIALVTGAGSGIGRVVAQGLLQDGFTVVAVGRQPEPLHSLVEEARSAGQQALVHMGLQHGAQAGEGLRVHGFKHFWPPALDV